jgi:hypothetical protein
MNSTTLVSTITTASIAPTEDRQRLADRLFRFAVGTNLALTLFAALAGFTGFGSSIAGRFEFNAATAGRMLFAILFFNGVWALIWYGVKYALLRFFVGMSRDDRRAVFSSRMSQPFDLPGLLSRYSERRIRIADMVGRRGRFITLAMAMFFYLYTSIATHPSGNFATAFTSQTLLDSVIVNWLFIAVYYANGFLGATFYGAQTRVMDGTLARANNIVITTLWSLFKFTLIPIGARLQALYSPGRFAVLFALIWGTYIIVDTLAEVGGSLYGTQKIRVRGIGDVNRKSVAGTVTGLVGGLVFSIGIVLLNGLPAGFIALAVTIAVASTALELFSPRGTDDFTMATGNALICWAFGAWVLG